MNCPGCGRTVSPTAQACPFCKRPQFTAPPHRAGAPSSSTNSVIITPGPQTPRTPASAAPIDHSPIRYAASFGGTERRPRILFLRCPDCNRVIREQSAICYCGRSLPNMSGSIFQKYRMAWEPKTATQSSLYVLASVGPPVRFLSSTPLKNVGLAVDISPANDERRKTTSIQQALEFVIDQMEPTDHLTLCFFSSRTYTHMAHERVEDRKRAKAMLAKKLDSLSLGDGRNLSEALDVVGREVIKNVSKDRLNQIVVLTDGICSDEADCLRKSRELNEGGISVSALGLGDRDRVNLNFLTQLTQVGGGRCYHRVDLSHIPEILAQELRAIKAVYATNVELYLRVVGDFQPVRSFRVGPFISDLGRIPSDTAEICLPLSDLQLHDSQDILIELTTRPNPSHTTDVLAASVKTDFPSEEVLNWSFTEMVSVPNSRQSFASLSDPTVMSMVKLVKAFDSSGLGVG